MTRMRGLLRCMVLAMAWGASLVRGETGPSGAANPAVPESRYFVDPERYRFAEPNVENRDFYPWPREEVTRDSYLRIVDATRPEETAGNPERGMDGPRAFMPVLVKFVQSGDPMWGEACVSMLRAFHAEMKRQVAERNWFWQFEHPAGLIPIYRDHLVAGGVLRPDDPGFREMWLFYCRNLHVWDSPPVEWRGGCHRSMPEAYAKGLAAKWYPDIPEAAAWARYSELVFGDFWRTKEAPQNDTGYMMGPLIILICGGDQWTGDDRVYTEPGMARLWERLMNEVTPDGAVNPYGPNGGWNSTADYRIAMLERLSTKTGDGRYKWVAHKLLNHWIYQQTRAGGGYRFDYGSEWLFSLAWLFSDESVVPRKPDSGSLWTKRMEAARIPHTDKELTERLLGNADPRPNHGHLCCSWFMTGKEWPDKLILRSGWNSGDLFALVELHPTSFPANPGGIMGLNRWGAPFTQIVTSKGASVENRLLAEDLDGKAPRRCHPDTLRIDEFWHRGTMPDIQSEVIYFRDTQEATYARVRVSNMDGLPVVYEREFIFAKNRFLATREIVVFEAAFHARLSPIWNTQNIGPQIGPHWANTFVSGPVGENGTRSLRTPPADLLVWFAPRAERRIQTINRLERDPRAEACPNQVRYLWEGESAPGDRQVFTQLYYPHMPYRSRPTSNNPNPNAEAAYADERQATAHASGIRVLRDDPDASILKLELEPGRVEWVVFNPSAQALEFGGHRSSESFIYQDERRGDEKSRP